MKVKYSQISTLVGNSRKIRQNEALDENFKKISFKFIQGQQMSKIPKKSWKSWKLKKSYSVALIWGHPRLLEVSRDLSDRVTSDGL